MPKNELKKIVEYSSFAVMLVVSVIFSFMGYAVEMALAIGKVYGKGIWGHPKKYCTHFQDKIAFL